jgi:hypothetical protein
MTMAILSFSISQAPEIKSIYCFGYALIADVKYGMS